MLPVLKRALFHFTVPHLWQGLPKTAVCSHTWWTPSDASSFLPNRLALLNRTEPSGQLNICRGRTLKTNLFVENWTRVPAGGSIRRKVTLKDDFLGAVLKSWTGCAALTTSPLPRTFTVLYSSWKPPKRCHPPHL